MRNEVKNYLARAEAERRKIAEEESSKGIDYSEQDLKADFQALCLTVAKLKTQVETLKREIEHGHARY